MRVAGVTLSPHNPNHRAFWHRIHLSPSLLPGHILEAPTQAWQVAVMSVTSQRQGPAWFGVVHLTS